MDVVLADLHADESSDDLTDDGSWAEQGRQEGQRADEAKDDEAKADEAEFIMLRQGKIAFEGNASELREVQKRDPYIEAFLS